MAGRVGVTRSVERRMFEAIEKGAFGACTNYRSCEAVCPKEISISGISRMNKDYRKAGFAGAAALRGKKP